MSTDRSQVPRDPRERRAPAARNGHDRARLAWPLGGLAVLVLAACPGSLDNKADFEDGASVCDAPATILGPRCATSNCHDAEDPVSGLDLTPDPGLVARLSGVQGRDCPDGLLVDTTTPEASLVLTKC